MYCQDLKGQEDPYSLLPFSLIGYRLVNANQFFKLRLNREKLTLMTSSKKALRWKTIVAASVLKNLERLPQERGQHVLIVIFKLV
jgi:hypothetical protein